MGELLTIHQAARQFKLSVTWLKSQARAGALPHLQAGRVFLFNSAALTATLARLAAEIPHKDTAEAGGPDRG